jgi:hypothetical protein
VIPRAFGSESYSRAGRPTVAWNVRNRGSLRRGAYSSSTLGGDPWSDPSAVGLQGWASLTGQWAGWPSELPPDGYGGQGPTRAWSTVLNVNIADDQGHLGHGSCSPGTIPSASTELTCSLLFTR